MGLRRTLSKYTHGVRQEGHVWSTTFCCCTHGCIVSRCLGLLSLRTYEHCLGNGVICNVDGLGRLHFSGWDAHEPKALLDQMNWFKITVRMTFEQINSSWMRANKWRNGGHAVQSLKNVGMTENLRYNLHEGAHKRFKKGYNLTQGKERPQRERELGSRKKRLFSVSVLMLSVMDCIYSPAQTVLALSTIKHIRCTGDAVTSVQELDAYFRILTKQKDCHVSPDERFAQWVQQALQEASVLMGWLPWLKSFTNSMKIMACSP